MDSERPAAEKTTDLVKVYEWIRTVVERSGKYNRLQKADQDDLVSLAFKDFLGKHRDDSGTGTSCRPVSLAYVRNLVRYTRLSQLRDQQRIQENRKRLVMTNYFNEIEPEPSHEEFAERHKLIMKAFESLHPSDRAILEEKYFNQKTNVEIANLYGMKVDAVRQALSRARSRLKPIISQLVFDDDD